jgi:hypothetical protein
MATADMRTTRGRNQDSARVAAGQGYELRYFARKHGLTMDQARGLVNRVGNIRSKLNEAAEAMKRVMK